MKKLLLPLLLVLSLPATAQAPAERVFDIVAPAGSRPVEMVDGYTVLRQSGTTFGAVLTFMPETASSAWIPMAVVNTSGSRLKVGTRGVSARTGDTELKVWSTTGLVRLAKDGFIVAPPEAVAAVEPGSAPSVGDAPVAPSIPDTIGPPEPGQVSQGAGKTAMRVTHDNDQDRQEDYAEAQIAALRERLFRDETIATGAVGRGDVRINLPPRRSDGQPAEFVLTLTYGGEKMDVLYRERPAAAAVVPAESAQ